MVYLASGGGEGSHAPSKRRDDTDAGEHRRPAIFRDQQQHLRRHLPFGGVVFCLGQFGDVFCSVAERDQRLSTRHHDRIEKPLIP